jgi:bifunctional DNA-binding transcriptional regulator/antitoxin component of YhaV-PrlF toxin-antitoxin module
MASKVSDRGQITIDRKARKELRVEPGMIAHQRVVDGRLEIVFLPTPHRRSLFGVLRGMGAGKAPVTAEELDEAVREAVAEKHDQARS